MQRRFFLKAIAVFCATTKFAYSEWQQKRFEAKNVTEIIGLITKDSKPVKSNLLMLAAPEITAEPDNVLVHLVSEVPGTELILLLDETRSSPLIFSLRIGPGLKAECKAQISILEKGRLKFVVKTKDGFFYCEKEVKVAFDPLSIKEARKK